MSSLPYYKRYTKDFLEGTVGMNGELKGAYSVLLDLIYIQSGKLPDDPHYISGNLGYSVRKWNSIKKELISRGKIFCDNGIISNKRADKEQIILSKYRDNQAEKGAVSNKNNNLAETTAPTVYYTETDTEDTTLLSASADLDQEKIDLMVQALGITDENKTVGFLSWSEPLNWISNGCSFDHDIIPTLKAIASRGKAVNSWSYCSQAIFEAKAKREAPAPDPSNNVTAFAGYKQSETAIERVMRQAQEQRDAAR
jgi:uncharacterized protein YdaU (DUF1376 family)